MVVGAGPISKTRLSSSIAGRVTAYTPPADVRSRTRWVRSDGVTRPVAERELLMMSGVEWSCCGEWGSEDTNAVPQPARGPLICGAGIVRWVRSDNNFSVYVIFKIDNTKSERFLFFLSFSVGAGRFVISIIANGYQYRYRYTSVIGHV